MIRRTRLRPRRAVLACILPLLLGACAVGPDYVRPDLPVPDQFQEGAAIWKRVGTQDAAVGDEPWWQAWNDPHLDELERMAQEANPSIATAEAAWRQAQAAIGQARAAGRPQVGVGVTQSRTENAVAAQGLDELDDGRIRQTAQAQVTASWELDLWGRVRRTVEAQGAQARASEQDLAAQRLSIAATVASTYLSLRQMDAQSTLLAEQRQANTALLEMTEAAYRLGTASPNDLVEARNNRDASAISYDATLAARAKYLHALAVLTGHAPSDFTLAPWPDYAFAAPAPPPIVPADLLLRRPDVSAAEARVESANASVGVAKAAYFPSLSLSASGGYVGGSLSDLLDAPVRVWSGGGQLLGTLFDGGARRSQTAQALAAYDGAVAQYRQAVLSALQSTEDALSDYRYQERQMLYTAQVLTRRNEVCLRKQQELVLGTTHRRDVLVETLSCLNAKQNALDAQAALAQDAVALFKAVGGGWPQ
ncbi:efflux transporter outer membrane subunit [Pseudomonas aeruginosa]|uniref:efflux transporter outer membrane subunit n=1 Tax=Stenotrophomonas maltophilia TaxID=40324 RepID=UPI001094EC79|nr:efflux transporter outer membrane subunit [Stenotrophomonas maltophilia]MCO3706766.1 efflux transporter outer membrane subunit [Pseudomonas aeruginosa]HCL2752806.1 efflux transporter outer membrane subunit [Pseudomonas aeruginosa 449A]TGW20673.1 efflux transporter outer membrane subunit [Stenotrophomonas maltophilia]HCL2765150.1 efflux transporter outer membrane subunit [Pseudomonas aeruginosa 449A]HCL2771365.1 efflux transporter outer membrane subunit [Pseudomonas aeruginosa 449A]